MTTARRRRLETCAVAVLALAVTSIGVIWGTRVAAGSDAYGYVSQVDLWLRGDLHIDQSFGARVPWPLARWTFLPLGYRPEPDGYRIVPQYPPGLPLLMAGARLVAGPCAMFWVVPICGGVLVVATYAIGRQLGRPAVALAAAWIVATSPTLLFMICFAIPSRAIWRTPSSSRARPLFLGCAAVVWIVYLLYVPWDAWWYLRFLLPTWPMVAIGTASLLATLGSPYEMVHHPSSFGWRRPAAIAVVALLGALGVAQAARRETFNAARGEAKYVEVARVVESMAGPDDVIISAQHSGSIRYYAGRLTLRWDVGDVAWLDRTVEWLAAHGHHPYFVLEPQEIEQLRAKYGPSNAVARLDWSPLVVFRGGAVTMYDALRREKGGAPVAQPELRAVRECLPQRPAPRLR